MESGSLDSQLVLYSRDHATYPFSPWQIDDELCTKLTLSYLQFMMYIYRFWFTVFSFHSSGYGVSGSILHVLRLIAVVTEAGRRANRMVAMEAKGSCVWEIHSLESLRKYSNSCRFGGWGLHCPLFVQMDANWNDIPSFGIIFHI